MIATSVLFWWGIWILAKAWRQRQKAHSGLVTDGLYARVRHPQYLGLFMIITALLLQWPTLITLLMAPVLFLAYRRVAAREERVLTERFGQQYVEYRAWVPAFVPRWWGQPKTARLMLAHELQINEVTRK
jgi:protein-S-isoprenylcysteine O-methyltransferase Ste14